MGLGDSGSLAQGQNNLPKSSNLLIFTEKLEIVSMLVLAKAVNILTPTDVN